MANRTMSTPDTMDTIDEAEQAWREYKNNSLLILDSAALDHTVNRTWPRDKFLCQREADICF